MSAVEPKAFCAWTSALWSSKIRMASTELISAAYIRGVICRPSAVFGLMPCSKNFFQSGQVSGPQHRIQLVRIGWSGDDTPYRSSNAKGYLPDGSKPSIAFHDGCTSAWLKRKDGRKQLSKLAVWIGLKIMSRFPAGLRYSQLKWCRPGRTIAKV